MLMILFMMGKNKVDLMFGVEFFVVEFVNGGWIILFLIGVWGDCDDFEEYKVDDEVEMWMF